MGGAPCDARFSVLVLVIFRSIAGRAVLLEIVKSHLVKLLMLHNLNGGIAPPFLLRRWADDEG